MIANIEQFTGNKFKYNSPYPNDFNRHVIYAGVRKFSASSVAGGSALNGLCALGVSAGCLFGSVDHGSGKSLMPTASSGDKLPIRYDSSSFIISGDLCCWKKFQNGSIAEPAPIMIFSRPGCSGMNFVISYTPMPYVTQTLLSL